MKLANPIRPDLDKAKDQEEVNEKLLFSQNKNFGDIYNLLQNGVDFTYNFDGTLITSLTVYHDTSINVPHKLTRFAKNIIIVGGVSPAKGLITSSNKSTSVARFWLPNAAFLKQTGSDFWVSSAEGFIVGDTVRIGTSDYKISAIDGNKVNFESDPTVTVFEAYMYINSTTIDILVF